MAPRPLFHKRIIVFSKFREKPDIAWAEIAFRQPPKLGKPLEIIQAKPFLGDTARVSECTFTRGTRARHGFRTLTTDNREVGYAIILVLKSELFDGSLNLEQKNINRSIWAAVKPHGQLRRAWCGPVVAMRRSSEGVVEDITLGDFKHVIDKMMTYCWPGPVELHAKPASPHALPSFPGTLPGVKIRCYGELRKSGGTLFAPVNVSELRMMISPVTGQDAGISPISKRLGTPLRMWPIERVSEEEPADRINFDASFLMMECDPTSENWGQPEWHWMLGPGSVVVVRNDGQDLRVRDVQLMCYYTRHRILPRTRETIRAGRDMKAIIEVVDSITHENMLACMEEMYKFPKYHEVYQAGTI